MKYLIMGAAALIATSPALAQTAGPPDPNAKPVKKAAAAGEVSRNAPVNGVVILYGNQRCPTNADGNEVVVCQRRSASEQFRIPKEVREFQVTPENESWANKVVANENVGAAGVGSCSPVGPGGATGCFLKQARATKKDNQAKKAEEQHIQDALP